MNYFKQGSDTETAAMRMVCGQLLEYTLEGWLEKSRPEMVV